MIQVTTPLSYSKSSNYSLSVKSASSKSSNAGKRSALNLENCFDLKAQASDQKPKINLLDLLHLKKSENSDVFKPIGNRIIVPLKIPSIPKLKTLKPLENSKNTVAILPHSSYAAICANVKKENTSTFQFRKVIDMTLKSSSEVGVDCNALTPIDIKQEFQEDAKAFPVTAKTDKALKSTGVFTAFRDGKQKTNDKVKHLTSKLRSLQRFSQSHDDISEELTCLSWLVNCKSKQIHEILQKCNPDFPAVSSLDDYIKNDDNKIESIFTAYSKVESSQPDEDSINGKPPFSFSCLIFMAIEDSITKKLKVKDIYKWFCKHYPFFVSASSTWKNSIRHNLSLNRCFSKAHVLYPEAKQKVPPKQSLWCIHPAYRPNLVESLKRVVCHFPRYCSNAKTPAIFKRLINLPYQVLAPEDRMGNCERGFSSATLDLVDLHVEGSIKSEEQVDLIHHTIEEIFRDSYFQCGFTDFGDNDTNKDCDDELVVIRDAKEDHRYCSLEPSQEAALNPARRSSSSSKKSDPDEAYEFETVHMSEGEMDMDIVHDIMEEIMVVSDEDEKESLFDSGFGSCRSFETKKAKSQSKKKSKSKQKPCKAQPSNIKSKGYQTDIGKKLQEKRNPKKLKTICSKQKIENREKKVQTQNLGKTSTDNRSKISSYYYSHRNNSTNYSSNSKYNTRSKNGRASNQPLESRKRIRRERKDSFRRSLDASEEEEVKRAAGSLLRLAGVMSHA